MLSHTRGKAYKSRLEGIMTLLITLLTQDAIFHSADHRLTDGNTGLLVTDTSSKVVVLRYRNWHGFISYTGVGRSGRPQQDTSKIVMGWLTGVDRVTPQEVAEKLQHEGNKWLLSLCRNSADLWPHAFILGAIQANRHQLFMISNFRRIQDRPIHGVLPSLEISAREYTGRPFVVLAGRTEGVTREARKRLQRLGARASVDASKIRRRLAEMNRTAAESAGAKRTISRECIVFSMDKYGGIADKQQRADATSYEHLVNGMPMPDLSKLLPSAFNLVGTAFGTERPPMLEDECELRTIKQTTSYRIGHIKLEGASRCSATDINDNGHLIGVVDFWSPRHSAVWRAYLDNGGLAMHEVTTISGRALAISHDAVIVGGVTIGDGSAQHAFAMHAGNIVDLGTFQGLDSEALAINNHGLIAGWASIDPTVRGQTSYRPCIWDHGKITILNASNFDEGANFEWAQAIDINDSGEVLILGYTKPDDSSHDASCNGQPGTFEQQLSLFFRRRAKQQPMTIVWDIRRQITTVAYGIIPLSISTNGTILGLLIHEGSRRACRKLKDAEWQLLGTEDQYEPVSMNDLGDVVGYVRKDDYDQVWIRYAEGDVVLLPAFHEHNCRPSAINTSRIIVGHASSDRCRHAVVWIPTEHSRR
jgi:hypothetical protein